MARIVRTENMILKFVLCIMSWYYTSEKTHLLHLKEDSTSEEKAKYYMDASNCMFSIIMRRSMSNTINGNVRKKW